MGGTRLTLGLSANIQVPQQKQFYTFSQTSHSWEFVTHVSHLCLLGASQVWLPSQNRPQISHKQCHICFGGAICCFTYTCRLSQQPTHRDLQKRPQWCPVKAVTNLALCTHQRGSLDQLSKDGSKNDENICTKRAFISVLPTECSDGLT